MAVLDWFLTCFLVPTHSFVYRVVKCYHALLFEFKWQRQRNTQTALVQNCVRVVYPSYCILVYI